MSVELLLTTTTKPNYSYKNKNHNNNIDINKTISLMECDLIKISLVCRSLFVFSKLKRTQPITYLWTFLIISKKFIKQLVVVIDSNALTREVVTWHKSANGVESAKLRKGGAVREFVVWAEIIYQLCWLFVTIMDTDTPTI